MALVDPAKRVTIEIAILEVRIATGEASLARTSDQVNLHQRAANTAPVAVIISPAVSLAPPTLLIVDMAAISSKQIAGSVSTSTSTTMAAASITMEAASIDVAAASITVAAAAAAIITMAAASIAVAVAAATEAAHMPTAGSAKGTLLKATNLRGATVLLTHLIAAIEMAIKMSTRHTSATIWSTSAPPAAHEWAPRG